jgi:hypothetical protein
MIIGFTGTSDKVTAEQRTALNALFRELGVTRVHHGDCVGGDAAADYAAARLGIPREAHPGLDKFGRSPKRAFCLAEVIHEPRPYIERNHIIVEYGKALIACPKEIAERQRSGTWATVRFARTKRRRIWFVWPDGRVSLEVPR